jgi:hypothetical protein
MMRWPRSLFGRLILLLVTVVGLVALTSFLLFNHDRAALLANQFNDTKLVQMKALRAALEGADGPSARNARATRTRIRRPDRSRKRASDDRCRARRPGDARPAGAPARRAR